MERASAARAKGDAQKASGAVMRALAAIQTELAPTIGYDGADGYVQLQVALMEHLADPAVAHATQAATHALCAPAGITPPTSPPQECVINYLPYGRGTECSRR